MGIERSSFVRGVISTVLREGTYLVGCDEAHRLADRIVQVVDRSAAELEVAIAETTLAITPNNARRFITRCGYGDTTE